MPEEKVCVEISKEKYEIAEKVAKEGGFSTVSELVEFLIDSAAAAGEIGGLSPEEEEKVAERLKKLGYY